MVQFQSQIKRQEQGNRYQNLPNTSTIQGQEYDFSKYVNQDLPDKNGKIPSIAQPLKVVTVAKPVIMKPQVTKEYINS